MGVVLKGVSHAAKAAMARLKAAAAKKKQQKDHLTNTNVCIYMVVHLL